MTIHYAEVPDDLLRTAPPHFLPHEVDEDAPVVTRARAVTLTLDCLSGDAPTSFGLTAAQWADSLMNELADNWTDVLLALLMANTVPHVRNLIVKHLQDCIEGTANRLLAEMDPDQAQEYL